MVLSERNVSFTKFKKLIPSTTIRPKPVEKRGLQSTFLNGEVPAIHRKKYKQFKPPAPATGNLRATEPKDASLEPQIELATRNETTISESALPEVPPTAAVPRVAAVNISAAPALCEASLAGEEAAESKRRRKLERKEKRKEKKRKKKKRDDVDGVHLDLPLVAVVESSENVSGLEAEAMADQLSTVDRESTEAVSAVASTTKIVNSLPNESLVHDKVTILDAPSSADDARTEDKTRDQYRPPKKQDWILYQHSDDIPLDDSYITARVTSTKKEKGGATQLSLRTLNCELKTFKVVVKPSTYGSKWRFATQVQVNKERELEDMALHIECEQVPGLETQDNSIDDSIEAAVKDQVIESINQLPVTVNVANANYQQPQKQDWIIYRYSDELPLEELYFVGRVTSTKKGKGGATELNLRTLNCKRKSIKVVIKPSTYGSYWRFATQAQVDAADGAEKKMGLDDTKELDETTLDEDDHSNENSIHLPEVGDFVVHRHNDRQSLEESFVIAEIIRELKRVSDSVIDFEAKFFHCIRKQARIRLKLNGFKRQWRYATDAERRACHPQSPSPSSNDALSIASSIVCLVCGSGDDAPTLLLCDKCNRGTHLSCFQPPLLELPQDEVWLCDACAWAMNDDDSKS